MNTFGEYVTCGQGLTIGTCRANDNRAITTSRWDTGAERDATEYDARVQSIFPIRFHFNVALDEKI